MLIIIVTHTQTGAKYRPLKHFASLIRKPKKSLISRKIIIWNVWLTPLNYKSIIASACHVMSRPHINIKMEQVEQGEVIKGWSNPWKISSSLTLPPLPISSASRYVETKYVWPSKSWYLIDATLFLFAQNRPNGRHWSGRESIGLIELLSADLTQI